MTQIDVSVVLVVDRVETGAATVEALRRQTLAPRLELVLVGPGLRPPPGLGAGFASLTTLGAPTHPLSSARAAGIAASTGRAVFVAETHGYPRPDCLERLLQAVEEGAAAVMPRLVNANPATARSHASLLATYGAFTGARPRPLGAVALHNGMFERTRLAAVAERPQDLVYGVGLSDALARTGLSMRFVPGAVVDHLNVVRPRGVLADRLIGGQLWAGMRSRSWSARRRAAHVVGAPLAPLVMSGRIFGSDGWRVLRPEAPRGTAALVVAFSALQTVGEIAGYLRGPGECERRHVHLELHREAYV
jgi:hypothetical protein